MNKQELVQGVNVKDEKVWKIFFDSYYEALCNHGFRILADEHVVEDVVQEIFIRLWDGHATFENEKALLVYLYRSVTNNALKYLRDRNSEDKKLKLWQQFEDELSEEDFSSIVREEVVRRLRQIIQQLPAKRRQIILMSMEGLSGEEIARKLNISITTVKQQKYRAYKEIKGELGALWIVALLLFY